MKHGLVLFQKLLYHYSILRISFCTYILDELFFPIHKEPQLIFESTINFWNVVFFFGQPCLNGISKQTRSRKIMRHASMYNPRCGETEDYKDCMKDMNCVDYHWEWMAWTSCLINNGQEECGVGLQERFPVCRTHNEVDVDDRICTKVNTL